MYKSRQPSSYCLASVLGLEGCIRIYHEYGKLLINHPYKLAMGVVRKFHATANLRLTAH